MLKVTELFSGIDSQRETLKRTNIEHEVVAISDNDKYVSKAYELLHEKTNNLGDIKQLIDYQKPIHGLIHFNTRISVGRKNEGF